MSKKLDIDIITNDLEGSAFFPQKKSPLVSPTSQPVTDAPKPKITQASTSIKKPKLIEEPTPSIEIKPKIEPNQNIPERSNASTQQRTNGKRIITRNSFEIYEDQMDSLRKLSYHEKMEGKLGSMSGMVREAIDTYLLKKTSGK